MLQTMALDFIAIMCLAVMTSALLRRGGQKMSARLTASSIVTTSKFP
jgi:hypothetical protein